jgi:signal transduction histidine kinase
MQAFRVADQSGNVVANTTNPEDSGKLTSVELANALPMTVNGQQVGYLLPERRLTFTPEDQSALVDRLNQAGLSAALISGGFSIVIALVLAYGLLRPVHELTVAAGKLAEGDLSQRVPVQGNDELASLGQAFNEMAATLQLAEKSRRAMTADIAHELRTPLSVQRANLEALQDGVYALTVDNLQPILDQNELLTRLVEDLRTLALADAGQLNLERTLVNVEELTQEVVSRFRPAAMKRKVTLTLCVKGKCGETALDRQRVEQILNNLLSNSLRYTPAGSEVSIHLACEKGTLTLKVRDRGPGIPAESLPHVFERFYRVDRSRSREEGGTGLGLSIARKLAQGHGGDLAVSNHPEGGALFTLTIPSKPQTSSANSTR